MVVIIVKVIDLVKTLEFKMEIRSLLTKMYQLSTNFRRLSAREEVRILWKLLTNPPRDPTLSRLT